MILKSCPLKLNCNFPLIQHLKRNSFSGFFEVELENGEVLHSKKNGDGYVDTPAKKEKIINGIENALK